LEAYPDQNLVQDTFLKIVSVFWVGLKIWRILKRFMALLACIMAIGKFFENFDQEIDWNKE